MIKNKIFFIIISFFLSAVILPSVSVQAQNETDAKIKQQPSSAAEEHFLTWDLSLSPSPTGDTNGKIGICFNWVSFLETRSRFNYLSTQDVVQNNQTDSTKLTSTSTVSCEPVRINQNLLWILTGTQIDWLSFYTACDIRYVNIDNKSYGTTASGGYIQFYKDENNVNFIKPLLRIGGGYKNDFIASDFFYELSPVQTNEKLTGNSATSQNQTTVNYSGNDTGLETRFGGNIDVTFKYLGFYLSGEWYRHIGYNRYIENGVTLPYAYETIDWTSGGGLILSFLREKNVVPRIGFLYTVHAFTPDSRMPGPLPATRSNQWRAEFGIENSL